MEEPKVYTHCFKMVFLETRRSTSNGLAAALWKCCLIGQGLKRGSFQYLAISTFSLLSFSWTELPVEIDFILNFQEKDDEWEGRLKNWFKKKA